MFSFTELRGQSKTLHKSGTVELNTQYATRRKPAWLVLLKLLGVAAMVAVGYAIALPTLLELAGLPLWQSLASIAGAMLVYTGIAFFFRPEPNTDNMGVAGGLVNDPFQYSDNVNRFLFKLHCVLGPGRFTAETLLDLCVLLRLAGGPEVIEGSAPAAATAASGASAATAKRANASRPAAEFSLDPTRPIAPLDPNRFALSSANYVAGQIQLETQRFTAPPKQST